MKASKITNDRGRMQFLKGAQRYYQDCMQEGQRLPIPEIGEKLACFPKEFDNAMETYRKVNTRWREAVEVRQEKVEKLSRCTRDFYNVLQRRTARDGHSKTVCAHYKTPTDGNFPFVSQVLAWEVLAEDLIEGEAAALEDGYPAMVNPSVEEVQIYLDAVRAEDIKVKIINKKRMDAQKTLSEKRDEADAFMRRINHHLTGWLLEETPSRRRVIMRDYGFMFESNSSDDAAAEENQIPEPEQQGSQSIEAAATLEAAPQSETIEENSQDNANKDVLANLLDEEPLAKAS